MYLQLNGSFSIVLQTSLVVSGKGLGVPDVTPKLKLQLSSLSKRASLMRKKRN